MVTVTNPTCVLTTTSIKYSFTSSGANKWFVVLRNRLSNYNDYNEIMYMYPTTQSPSGYFTTTTGSTTTNYAPTPFILYFVTVNDVNKYYADSPTAYITSSYSSFAAGTPTSSTIPITMTLPKAGAIMTFIVRYAAGTTVPSSGYSTATFTNTGSATLTCTLTGLSASTTYAFLPYYSPDGSSYVMVPSASTKTAATTSFVVPTATVTASAAAGAIDSATVAFTLTNSPDSTISYRFSYGSTSGATLSSSQSGVAQTITGLASGTSYTFQLQYSASGSSTWTSVNNASSTCITSSLPSGTLSTSSVTSTGVQVTLSLTTAGPSGTSYRLSYGSGQTSYTTQFTASSSTSYTASVTGLSDYTSYTFQAQYALSSSSSTWTNVGSALSVTTSVILPVLASFAVTGLSSSVAILLKTATSGSTGTTYQVRYGVGTSSTSYVAYNITPGSTYTLSGLGDYTSYSFIPQCVSPGSTAATDLSATAYAVTTSYTAPSLTSLTLTSGTKSIGATMKLSQTGSSGTAYRLVYGTDSTFATGSSITVTPGITLTVSGLLDYTLYYVKAQYYDPSSSSYKDLGASTSVRTSYQAPASSGVSLVAGTQSFTAMLLLSQAGSSGTVYRLLYGTDQSFASGTAVALTADWPVNVTGLADYVTYYAQAFYYDPSAASYKALNSISSVTTSYTAPSSGQVFLDPAATSLSARYSYVSGSTGTAYRLAYRGSDASEYQASVSLTSTAGTTTLSGLITFKTYDVQLQYLPPNGTSWLALSTSSAKTLLEVSLSLSACSTSLKIFWAAKTASSSEVPRYKIALDGQSVALGLTGSSYLLTGISPASSHTVSLYAY